MGDRYCVGFTGFDDDGQDSKHSRVWLYAHWGGGDRYRDIADAISLATPRHGDATYATRIAISHLVGDSWKAETGWGIEPGEVCRTHVEYDPLLVNWHTKTVTEWSSSDREKLGTLMYTWTFKEWLALNATGAVVLK